MSALAIGLIGILAALTLTAIVVSSVSMYRVDRVHNIGIVGARGDRGPQGVPGNQGPQGVAGSVADFKAPVATLINPAGIGWTGTPIFEGIGSDYRGTINGSLTWTSAGQGFSIFIVYGVPYGVTDHPGSIVVSIGNNNAPLKTDFVISWQYGGGSLGNNEGFNILLITTRAPPVNPTIVGMLVSYIVLP